MWQLVNGMKTGPADTSEASPEALAPEKLVVARLRSRSLMKHCTAEDPQPAYRRIVKGGPGGRRFAISQALDPSCLLLVDAPGAGMMRHPDVAARQAGLKAGPEERSMNRPPKPWLPSISASAAGAGIMRHPKLTRRQPACSRIVRWQALGGVSYFPGPDSVTTASSLGAENHETP
jgi:hypothetical protein